MGVLWSARTKSVILGELTCPAEENFSKANTYKMDRYAILCEQIRDAGWKVSIRTFAAGARGFVGHRFPRFLRELGLSSKEARQACKDISLVTARCSYGIYLMRKTHIWNVSRELVVPNHFLQHPPFTTPYPLLADLSARDGCDWHTAWVPRLGTYWRYPLHLPQQQLQLPQLHQTKPKLMPELQSGQQKLHQL